MEITSIHFRRICPVCAAQRRVICEPHKLANHILMPVEGAACGTPQCTEHLPPFLYAVGNAVCVPSSVSIERFKAFRGALQEAALYNSSSTLTVGFSLASISKAENDLAKIKEKVQKYEEAKIALVRFFNEFLP